VFDTRSSLSATLLPLYKIPILVFNTYGVFVWTIIKIRHMYCCLIVQTWHANKKLISFMIYAYRSIASDDL
jgi:hypothetical protein